MLWIRQYSNIIEGLLNSQKLMHCFLENKLHRASMQNYRCPIAELLYTKIRQLLAILHWADLLLLDR